MGQLQISKQEAANSLQGGQRLYKHIIIHQVSTRCEDFLGDNNVYPDLAPFQLTRQVWEIWVINHGLHCLRTANISANENTTRKKCTTSITITET